MSFRASFSYRNINEDGQFCQHLFYFDKYTNVSSNTGTDFVEKQIRDLGSKKLKFFTESIRFDKIYNISQTETLNLHSNQQDISLSFPPGLYRIRDVENIVKYLEDYVKFEFKADGPLIDRGTLKISCAGLWNADTKLYISRKLSVILGLLLFRDFDKTTQNVCVELKSGEVKEVKFNLMLPLSELRLHSNIFLNATDYEILLKIPSAHELAEMNSQTNMKVMTLGMKSMSVERPSNIRSAAVYFLDIFNKCILFNFAELQMCVKM